MAKEVIGPNQTGFVKERNILEGVLILHEVIHELKRSKMRGVVLKIDFEKAYDKVRWDFLELVMRGKVSHRSGQIGSCKQSEGGKFV
jgi:hypothetical protein